MIGLQRLAIPSCPPAKCPPFSLVTPSGECVSHQSSVTLTLYTKQQALFSTAPADLPAVFVVFIDILPNRGLFGIIKQICHGSVLILMECPRENHPPSGRHSIRIPTLPWHICVLNPSVLFGLESGHDEVCYYPFVFFLSLVCCCSCVRYVLTFMQVS